MKKIFFSLLLVFFAIISYSDESSFTHPGLLINKERIKYIKEELVKDDPVISKAYAQLIIDADSCLNKSPNIVVGDFEVPNFYKFPKEHMAIKEKIKVDSKSCFCLALAYAISGDIKYANKSKEFLFAWVNNLGKPKDSDKINFLDIFDPQKAGGDTQLVITYTFPNFIYAFDILSGLGVLTPDEESNFRSWLKTYVDFSMKECFYKNNHHSWQSLFIMCAGYALNDKNIFNTGVKYYKNGFILQVQKDGALVFELWRKEKCSTYTLMALEAMLQGACIASNNGYSDIWNMKSKYNGNIKNAVDCMFRFLDKPDNWLIDKRKKYAGYTEQIAPNNKSDWGWIFEMPYSLWKDEKYLRYMNKRPYGDADRTYTLIYSTLLFAK